jgi:hypothetical protein
MQAQGSVETLKMVVNRRALVRACGRAAQAGVGRGGVYDVRGSALVVWGEPWSALPMKPGGEPIGMVSWRWGVPAPPFATVHRVEAGPLDRGNPRPPAPPARADPARGAR